MSFNPDSNVVQRNLEHWFKFDHLSPKQGIAILLGIEPDDESINALNNWYSDDPDADQLAIIKSGIRLLTGDVIGGEENRNFRARHSDTVKDQDYDYSKVIITYEQSRFSVLAEQYYQILQYWDSGKHPKNLPPLYFIEWALSKNIHPAWLDDAIKFGLYAPKQETVERVMTSSNNSSIYSTKWLEVQKAAIAYFFNPRRNPDAKKDEVIKWINAQAVSAGLVESQNVASAIFSIIKPENHDPKKIRSEPQQGQ